MKKEVTELDLRRPEFQDPKLKPEHFEFDADGEVVRKDRFETGMRKVHSVLIGRGLASARDKWTVDSVVDKVKCAIDEANRLKLLIKIVKCAPEDAEYFHFENMHYVKDIDQEDHQHAKENLKDSPLIGFKSKKIETKDQWGPDSGWLPYIEVLVSISDIKKEINELVGVKS